MHLKSFLRQLRLLTIILPFIVLAGCFDDGSGPDKVRDAPSAAPPPPQALIGRLVNASVSGAEFETPTQSGLTEAGGQFPYMTGENVTFTVGTIFLGTVQAADIITPVELTGSAVPTAAAATNMLVFLQSIDADSPNYGNGIAISAATRAAAEGLTLDFNSPNFDMEVAAVVAVIAPGNAVVSEQTALDNFYLTYVDLGGFTTFGWPFPGYPPFPPPRDSIEDGGFEPPGVPDASGGNQGDCAPGDLGAWSTFNCNFVTSTLGPSSAPVSHDEGGTQSLIQYGVDAGAENVIEALAGDFVELSAWAMSWVPDPFNNLAILQLTFWDAPGGRLGGGNQIGAAIETFADSLGNQPHTLLPQDGAEVSDWTSMSVSGVAPAGSQSAQVLLIHVLIDGTPETGAIYWDDVRLTSIASGGTPPDPDLQLIWSDEFDIDGEPSSDWTLETGYGVNNSGWGNDEWQLYTTDPANVRVENGNLEIRALCGSSTPAPGEGYFQDFDGLNLTGSLSLANDGWMRYTSVWLGDVGTGTFLYDYGGSAANASSGSGQMSAIAVGEGANGAGDQYLNIFTDYENADLSQGATLSVNIFQEQTIGAADIGSTWTFDFTGKAVGDTQFRLAPPATGTAFIKTLDPNNGFNQTNLVSVDTSTLDPDNWNSLLLSIDLTDPLLEGQLLQFGFNVDTVGTGPTGVYYDNISFTNGADVPTDCVPGKRDGSITSARINTSGSFSFTFGKIEARIRAPVGTGAWPAFWMLGANFPEVGWPFSGELDVMEIHNRFSDEYTTHATMHWCDETKQNPATPEVCFPQDEGWTFVTDDLSLSPESLGDDFHVYSAVWDADGVVGSIDGQAFFNLAINPATMDEFLKAFFIILNVAIGGTLGGAPDATTPWPQTMLVDWVRVYQDINP